MSIYRTQPPLKVEGLTPGAIFEIEDRRFVWQKELGDGEVHVEDFNTGELHRMRDVHTGMRQIATVQWIQDAMSKGLFRILKDDAQGSRAQVPELDRAEILSTDPFAEARETLLTDLHAAGVSRSHPDLSAAIERIWAEKLAARFGERPATSTVREWMIWTDPDLPSLAQLFSQSGRVARARRLDPIAQEVVELNADWYWMALGRAVKDCFARGSVEIEKLNAEREKLQQPPIAVPSREAYRREIRRTETCENWVRKYGKVAARRYWDPSKTGRLAKRALELVMLDDTVLDTVACIQTAGGRRFPAGRPYIIVALDLHTRCVVGWVLSFKPPTVHTAAKCLMRVGREKMFISQDWCSRYPVLRQIAGKPDAILVDNGKNFVSGAFQTGCADAGITLNYAPIRAPKAKAVMERFFRTLKTWLLQKLPGCTLEPKVMREFGYDPEKDAVFLVEELENLIREFVNTYHVSIHSGINEQPAAAWLRSIEAHPRAILNERALQVMNYITVHDRRLYANGVRWQHMTYRIGDLARLQAANLPREKMRSRLSATTACTVKIKIDPEDVNHIFVWDPSTKSYVELFSTQPNYAAGLSLDQHQQARAWAKKRNENFNTEQERIAAIDALNRYIEEHMPDLPTRQRRALARCVDDIAGSDADVPVLHAEATHDGMGQVIEHDAAEPDRLDSMVTPGRPSTGVVADGGSHDADVRDETGPLAIDQTTGMFQVPQDDDELYEEDYS